MFYSPTSATRKAWCRLGRILGGLIAVCGVSGCIHLEQSLEIKDNGSLRASYAYSIADDTFDAVKAGRRAVDEWQGNARADGLNWFVNEAAVREHFAKAGAEVVSYRGPFLRHGRQHVTLTVTAPDASKAFASGAFGAFRLAGEAGVERIRAEFAAPSGGKERSPKGKADALKAFCDDLWLRLEITVPGTIVSAPGATTRRRTATWVFEPGRDAEAVLELPQIEVVYKRAQP